MTTTPSPDSCDRSLAKRRPRLAARPLSDYPELMTIAEAATYLRVKTSTVSLLARLHLGGLGQDCLPAVRIGNEIRISRDRLAHGVKAIEPGTDR